MTETNEPSGRSSPDQTYPTESGVAHPPAPFTPDSAAQAANHPESDETRAHAGAALRVEHYPNLAHHTGGEDRNGSERRDPAVREDSDLAATARGAFPDERTGQRYEWRDDRPGRSVSLPLAGALVAGVMLIGVFALRRMR